MAGLLIGCLYDIIAHHHRHAIDWCTGIHWWAWQMSCASHSVKVFLQIRGQQRPSFWHSPRPQCSSLLALVLARCTTCCNLKVNDMRLEHISTYVNRIQICVHSPWIHLASAPGHSQLAFQRATLKSWEWPGDEARIHPHMHTGDYPGDTRGMHHPLFALSSNTYWGYVPPPLTHAYEYTEEVICA